MLVPGSKGSCKRKTEIGKKMQDKKHLREIECQKSVEVHCSAREYL